MSKREGSVSVGSSRRTRRRLQVRGHRLDLREVVNTFLEMVLHAAERSGRGLLDLLYVALLLSLAGEVVSIFTGEPVLVLTFLLTTLLLCIAAWRWGGE